MEGAALRKQAESAEAEEGKLLGRRRVQGDAAEIVRCVFAVDGMPTVVYICLHRRFMREF